MLRRNFLAGAASAVYASAIVAYSPAWSSGRRNDWQRLFNGVDLEGWTFKQEGIGSVDLTNVVSVDDETIRFLMGEYDQPLSPPGYIATRDEFSNYHFRFEYRWGTRRWPPRALQPRNSGILYHLGREREGKLFPQGVELQLQEGNVGDAIMIDTLAVQGPLLGGTPLWPNWIPAFPKTYSDPITAGGYSRQWHRRHFDFARDDGWNTIDLIAFEDQSVHLVNGRIVNPLFHMRRTSKDGELNPLTSGRIALEFEWAEVEFRKVEIRGLSASEIQLIREQGSY